MAKIRELDQITPWIPVVLWIAVIAWLGSGEFHYRQTSRIIGPLLHWLFPDWGPDRIAAMHGAIRKLAHPSVYAVEGLLAWRAWVRTLPSASRATLAALTLGLVVLVACADESRQALLPSRRGSVRDVGLDALGGVGGLALAMLIFGGPREAGRG